MSTPELSLRDIQESDVIEIYRWRNDPTTIKYSKTGRGVESKEHYEWFKKIEATNKKLTQIATFNDKPIGIIMYFYNSDENYFEISINISPEFRKLGFGKRILLLSEIKLLKEVGQCKIRAKVFMNNKNSIKFFTKCRYVLVQKNDDILIYEKNLANRIK